MTIDAPYYQTSEQYQNPSTRLQTPPPQGGRQLWEGHTVKAAFTKCWQVDVRAFSNNFRRTKFATLLTVGYESKNADCNFSAMISR